MMSKEQLIQLLQGTKDERAAQIYEAAINNPFEIQVFDLDLSTAQKEFSSGGVRIPFAFKSIIAISASDSTASIDIKFNSDNAGVSKVPFVWNQSQSTNLMYSGAYLSWVAQAGKTMKLVVGVTSDITSGSLINSGSIGVILPTVWTTTNPALSAGLATVLAALNTSRKRLTVQNNTGATVYLGAAAVTNAGATKGLELLSGGTYELLNICAFYAYSVGAAAIGTITVVEET